MTRSETYLMRSRNELTIIGHSLQYNFTQMAEVFISYGEEERHVALALKRLIEVAIVGCKPFVTADHWQMTAGERWLDRIATELQDTKVIIVLLSRQSVARPWINFEAGAAWLRGARVIPACVGSLLPKDLPKPYGDLQGVRLADDDELYQLIRSTTEAAGHIIPPPPPFHHERELLELREALSKLSEPGVGPVIAEQRTLSRDAEEILSEATQSATGQIVRRDLDQALVIQVNGKSITADLSQGRRRADLEGAIADLEDLGFVKDISGNRVLFTVTRSGYSNARNEE